MAERGLRHRTIAVDVDDSGEIAEPARRLPWPWWSIAVVGSIAVVAAGWLLVAGAMLLASIASPAADIPGVLALATRFLVLAYGAPVQIGGQVVTLVPLLLTLALVVLGQPVAAMAARHLAAEQATSDDTGELWVDGRRLVVRVAGTYAGSQALVVLVVGATTAGVGNPWLGAIGALTVGAGAGLWGASRAIRHDPRRDWPAWLRPLPHVLAVSFLTCLAGGAAAMAVTVFLSGDRIAAIHDALQPGALGGVLLLTLQLLYVPNLALWGTAWVLGAGVTLGDGSIANLGVTDVGFLPSIPVLGAVPDPGLVPEEALWWLLFGVVAGAVSAVLMVTSLPRARFDRTALVGAGTGIVGGLLVVVACSLAGGGLGSARLAHLGPLVPDVFVVAPSVLGLSGLVAGLVTGLIRRPAPLPAATATDGATDGGVDVASEGTGSEVAVLGIEGEGGAEDTVRTSDPT